MIKNIYIVTASYLALIVALLYVIMFSDSFMQIPIKVFCSSLLFVVYSISVLKEKRNKNYYMLLLFFFLGDVFYSYPTRFFSISLLFYGMVYIVFSLYIYKKELKKENWFRIFTFASPFIFTYGVIYTLLQEIDPLWMLGILIIGVITCINASLVVLNYANKRNRKNLLFFIGIFLIQMVNFLAVIHHFNEQKQSYYLTINTLSLVAQYLICLGFIMPNTVKK